MASLLDMIERQWLYDIEVLSRPLVLYPILPAVLYTAFMLIKWCVFSIPIWVPIRMSLNLMKDKKDAATKTDSPRDSGA